jgi:hypothetical protein
MRTWSGAVGVLSLLCTWPTLALVIARYRAEAIVPLQTCRAFAAVPLLYAIARIAERQLERDDARSQWLPRNPDDC